MKKIKPLLLALTLTLCLITAIFFTACGNSESTESQSSTKESIKVDSSSSKQEDTNKNDTNNDANDGGNGGTNDDGNDDGNNEENEEHVNERNEFIDGLGGVSETYAGSVSKESYDTPDQAASAYVSNEVAGKSIVQEIETVSMGELSENQINDLKLPEDLQENITSVEEFEVSYLLSKEAAAAISASDKSKIVIKVYIIRYGQEYKYYTPCPVNGETITKSYYDSVFSYDKYSNCTFVKNSFLSLEAMGQTFEMTITQNIKRADGKILFEQIISGHPMLVAQFASQAYVAAYMELDENGKATLTRVKTTEGGSWQTGYLTGVTPETLVPFYDQYLDYTYFTKTDFGFALKDDNAEQYYKETIVAQGAGQYLEGAELNLYAEYYVLEGILSGMRMEYSATLDVNGATQTTTGENTMTCTDYGTTVVEKPF